MPEVAEVGQEVRTVEVLSTQRSVSLVTRETAIAEVGDGSESQAEAAGREYVVEVFVVERRTAEFSLGGYRVVEIVREGPPGKQGNQGDPGPPGDASRFAEVEVTAAADGEQLIALSHEPAAFRLLTINGLQQSAAAYSIIGTTLTLAADLGVLAGDKIHFTFSRS